MPLPNFLWNDNLVLRGHPRSRHIVTSPFDRCAHCNTSGPRPVPNRRTFGACDNWLYRTRFERAIQIWSILGFAARSRQVLTYGILARMVGILPHHLGQFLEPVQSYCLLHGLPPLTAIVVQESTGLPGLGFTASEN